MSTEAITKVNILDHIDSKECGRTIAIDTETTGLDPYGTIEERGHAPDRPFLVTFTNGDGLSDSVRFNVNPFTREVNYKSNIFGYEKVKKILEDKSITKVMHNASFDVIMLLFAGINTNGKIFDTRIMAHVDSSARATYALKPLCMSILGIGDEDQQDLIKSVHKARRLAKKKGWCIAKDAKADYWLGDRKLCDTYGCMDTERTMALYWGYKELYDEDETYRDLVDMEHEMQQVAIEMQLKGIATNPENVESAHKYYDNVISVFTDVKEELGFGDLNPKSPKQMCKAFYEDMGETPILNKKTERPTCNSKALEKMALNGNELAHALLRLSAASHELTHFIEPLETIAYGREHVVHPNYNTVGPITGRISCSKPNSMNISSNTSMNKKTEVEYKARSCFVPRAGHVLYFPDYSQVEKWIAMFISRDKNGMEILLDGADMHYMLAHRIWGDRENFQENLPTFRKKAKSAGFGMDYGAGIQAIMELAQGTYKEAQAIKEGYLELYPGVSRTMKTLSAEVRKCGYITNPFGRKYYVQSGFEYKAYNYMIQGTAAEIMKRASIATNKLFKTPQWLGCRVLLNIHDEQGDEAPLKLHSKRLMREIVKAMQCDFHETINMPVPFPVGMKYTTTNWSEMIELEDL